MKKILAIMVLFFFVCENAYAGLSELFRKNEFKFERCYPESSKEYLNYNDWANRGPFLKWEWEINLKNKTATRISIFKHDNKTNVAQYPVAAITSEFIQTSEIDGTSYLFKRKTGRIQISTELNKTNKRPSIMKCEKFMRIKVRTWVMSLIPSVLYFNKT